MIAGLDILKFVLAFLVIAIHTHYNECNNVFETATSIAVPLFFAISGYLIQKKITDDKECTDAYFSKYLKKSLRLYITWSILFMPLTLYGFFHSTDSVFIKLYSLVRGWLLVGENYMSWPLWYLLALIVAVFLVKKLYKYISLEGIFALSVLLFGIGISMDYLHEHLEINSYLHRLLNIYYLAFKTTRNGIFLGLCYVSSGMLLAKYEREIWNKTKYALGPTVIISFYLTYLKIPFSTIIFIASILPIVLHCPFRSEKYNLLLREMSTLIYFSHMFYVAFYQIFLPETSPVIQFVMASLICTIVCSILIAASKTKKYSFVKKLIS